MGQIVHDGPVRRGKGRQTRRRDVFRRGVDLFRAGADAARHRGLGGLEPGAEAPLVYEFRHRKQLRVQQRLGVDDRYNGLQRRQVVLLPRRADGENEALPFGVARPEGDQHAHPRLHRVRQRFRYGIAEQAVKGEGAFFHPHGGDQAGVGRFHQ